MSDIYATSSTQQHNPHNKIVIDDAPQTSTYLLATL
jgi:hypothetical protein